MNKQILMECCKVLESYYNDYLRCNKRTDRDRIEMQVRQYVRNLPNELYLELNEGAASGLCKHGFFESDLGRCIKELKRMIL